MAPLATHAPPAVDRFMSAAERRDYATAAACFTENAKVTDEGQTHHGRAAIRAWQQATREKWTYTLTVRGGHAVSPRRYLIKAHLHGNFPGGDADVEYVFTLRGDLIGHLTVS